jgi:hypothetical protein
MLGSISWNQWWAILAFLLIIYYLIIIPVYYRNDLPGIVKKISSSFRPRTKSAFTQTSPQHLFSVSTRLAEAIEKKMEDASRSNTIREEFLFSLGKLLQDYPMIRETVFQTAINNLIVHHFKTIYSTTLSETEIKRLWTE